MPTRQERRKAERAAAKRAPAEATSAGAAGAGGAGGDAAAAAAREHVNVKPLGDWKTQTEDPSVFFEVLGGLNAPGVGVMMARKADAGDRAAQYSVGWLLLRAAGEDDGGVPSAAPPSPMVDVGLAVCTAQFPVDHHTYSQL